MWHCNTKRIFSLAHPPSMVLDKYVNPAHYQNRSISLLAAACFFSSESPPKNGVGVSFFLGGGATILELAVLQFEPKGKLQQKHVFQSPFFRALVWGASRGGIFPTKSDPQNQRLWVATVGDLGDFPFPDFRIFGFIPSFRDADWRVPHDRKVDHLDLDSDWPSEADYCCTQSKAHWPSSLKEST